MFTCNGLNTFLIILLLIIVYMILTSDFSPPTCDIHFVMFFAA